MTKKTGPWGEITIPPEVEAEHQAQLKKERMKKNPEKKMLDEAGIHWLELGPDDDLGEYLRDILKEYTK